MTLWDNQVERTPAKIGLVRKAHLLGSGYTTHPRNYNRKKFRGLQPDKRHLAPAKATNKERSSGETLPYSLLLYFQPSKYKQVY